MNYQKIYWTIISQVREKEHRSTRLEKHHILPVSLGGTNDPDNIVKVTPREHFILHLLLMKMHSGPVRAKMAAALILMIKNTNKRLGRQKVTNRTYDASRFWKTAKFSEEHRRKISEAARRRDPATRKQTKEANEKRAAALRGVKKKPDHVEKYAAAQRGKSRASWGSHSEEAKAKISSLHKGKPKSAAHRQALSEAHTGKKLAPWSAERRAKFAATIAKRNKI